MIALSYSHHNAPPRLAELCADFFALILHLRQEAEWGNFESLRAKLAQHFERMEKAARRGEIETPDVQDAKFALVAFLDEIILGSKWPHKDAWREWPLQLEYFKTNTAGHEFFERLDRLRSKRETKAELLEIYYLCLTLGFKGEFKIFGEAHLGQKIKELAQDFQQLRPHDNAALAPRAQRPAEETKSKKKSPVPARLVMVLCALVTILFTLVLWQIW